MSAPRDADARALAEAISSLQLDPTDARLISASSRLVWHLPGAGVALYVTRPGVKTRQQLDHEVEAVRAARAVEVRTPRVVAGPVELDDEQYGVAFEWVDGRPPASPEEWSSAADEAAKLGDAVPVAVPRLSIDVVDPAIAEAVLGLHLAQALARASVDAARAVDNLVAAQPAALCHGDLQPANVIVGADGIAWLLDFEYACLAPREWDLAKLHILTRRFGTPPLPALLPNSWQRIDADRLERCVQAGEVQLVGWLVRMAIQNTQRAGDEAVHRARTVAGTGTALWRHLA